MIERLTNKPMPMPPLFVVWKASNNESRLCSRQSHTRIADGQTYGVAVCLSLGFDQQLPRSILHVGHRIRGVAEQIQDDLLELNPIADDDREIIGELRLKDDATSLQVVRRERDDLSRSLVQIQRLERELPLAEQRT